MKKRAALIDEKTGDVLNVIVIDETLPEKEKYKAPKGAAYVLDDEADFKDKFEKRAGKFERKIIEALPEGN